MDKHVMPPPEPRRRTTGMNKKIMNRPFSICWLALCCLAFIGTAQAQTVTFNVDFEPPTYSLGLVGGGNFPGQDNWFGFGGQFVTNTQAHSGSQSLNTTTAGTVFKNFSTPDSTMNISKGIDWYMQTWAYVVPGASTDHSFFAASSVLGSAFYIGFSGDGMIDFNSGAVLQTINIGPSLFNKWLLVTINHPANDPNLEMSVIGA